MDSLDFLHTGSCHLQIGEFYIFPFKLDSFLNFSCLTTLGGASRTCWNAEVLGCWPYRKSVLSFTVKYDVGHFAHGWSFWPEEVPCTPGLLRVFITNGCWVWSGRFVLFCFLHLRHDHVVLVLLSTSVV